MTYNCYECGAPLVSISNNGMGTLKSYYSPPGHNHDDNCLTREVTCANGHAIELSIRRSCKVKACDWESKTTCTCHSTLAGLPKGTKLDEWPKGLVLVKDDADDPDYTDDDFNDDDDDDDFDDS